MKKKLPDLKHEEQLWKKGYDLVIGVDEVGRGAIAGPVVAGACAISNFQFSIFKNLGIDDSKRLTVRKREELDKIIRKEARWGIGEVGVATINKVGIVKATEKAMRSAIANCKLKIKNCKFQNKKVFVLVDAFHVKYIPGVGLPNQKGIIKGDQKVLSIAAASIIAKVYRDELMANTKNRYGWKRNKGYGTAEHLAKIKKYGLTKLHRLAFVKNII